MRHFVNTTIVTSIMNEKDYDSQNNCLIKKCRRWGLNPRPFGI